MNAKTKNTIVATLWVLTVGLCAYLQASPYALPELQKSGFLGPAVDIGHFRDGLALVAPIAAAVGFYSTAVRTARNKVLEEQRASLLRQTKDSFAQTLALKLGLKLHNSQTPELSVRIFLPERTRWLNPRMLFTKLLHRDNIRFRISNVKGLADRRCNDGLSFIVSPSARAQGLVGTCYNTKEIVLDDNLQNGGKEYNLSKQLSSATSDLVLCICVPVFKLGDTRDGVSAVVAFDSADILFKNAILNAKPAAIEDAKTCLSLYRKFLCKDIPELFD